MRLLISVASCTSYVRTCWTKKSRRGGGGRVSEMRRERGKEGREGEGKREGEEGRSNQLYS